MWRQMRVLLLAIVGVSFPACASCLKGTMLTNANLAASSLSVRQQHAAFQNATLRDYDYGEFRIKYGRSPAISDPISYEDRNEVFERTKKFVELHNSQQPPSSWVATVNRFADYTEPELKRLLGYKRQWRQSSGTDAASPSSSLLQTQPEDLVATKDWRHLRSSSFIRSQGNCGSCWAIAAVGAIELHAEVGGSHTQPVSAQQLIECSPNPQHCGGEGGCKGSTAELAFKYIKENGLASENDYSYSPGTFIQGLTNTCRKKASTSVALRDFVQLPTNKLGPLMAAVAHVGPVVVSVAADAWQYYKSGVFDSCNQDATVDHAVLALGYGVDPQVGKKYWLVRNSWGSDWGEQGYIRVFRHDSDEGSAGYCGTDYNPKEGVGCDGGNKTLPVCGMCGILSDSSYPVDVKINPATSSKRSWNPFRHLWGP